MPIARFQMPDGRIARFEVPEGTSPEQATSLMSNYFSGQQLEQPQQPQPEQPSQQPETRSAIERIGIGGGDIITQRGIALIQLLDEATGGAILSPEARQASYKAAQDVQKEQEGLGAAGTIGGIIADPLMLVPGGGAAAAGAKGLALAGGAFGGLSGALTPKQQEEQDRLAQTLESGAIGAVAGPIVGKATELAAKGVGAAGDVIGSVGKKLTTSAAKSMAKARDKFALDLVLPEKMAGKSLRSKESGLFRTINYNPVQYEKEMADAVSKIPSVNPKRTAQFNLNVLQKEVTDKSNKLEKQLSGLNITFPRLDFKNQAVRELQDLIDTHPVLVGNAAATANRLVPQFEKIVDSAPSTPAGLLSARKQFDTLLRGYKTNFFDTDTKSAFTEVGNALRQFTNNYIADAVPSVAVKNSLKQQHLLLSAIDNISPKADKLASNAISRLSQRVGKLVPLKAEVAGLAALGGVGLAISPAAVGAGAGLYGAGKMAASPATRKALGGLLQSTNKAINIVKDKAIKQEMLADKAIILELLKSRPKEEANDDTD